MKLILRFCGGFFLGWKNPLMLNADDYSNFSEDEPLTQAKSAGIDVGQQFKNLLTLRGFRNEFNLGTPYNWEKYKNTFLFWLIANILTMPLSPVKGGGLMTWDVYRYIFFAKFIFFGLMLLIGLYMWVSEKTKMNKKIQKFA